ncbi:methyl-CpG-binding domain-containing protein 2-like [Quercus robur]|uniref:methyl-CpG-binding domain-containing protein 2-like n=1 Tax=Quercus robur TaxID=38942 RepID=UPI002162AE05|nr:methyl-CpG-binding domain-containing protein 2-like [Quercus robur]
MVEVQKYFLEHPEHMTDGVTLSQFSFQIPRPLQENYVRKRPTHRAALCDGTRPLEPDEVSPLSWAGPDDGPDLQLNRSAMPSPYFEAPVFDPVHQDPQRSEQELLQRRCTVVSQIKIIIGVKVDG